MTAIARRSPLECGCTRPPSRGLNGYLPDASIPRDDQEAAKTWLAGHAKVCLKQVPRVYDIESATNVDR